MLPTEKPIQTGQLLMHLRLLYHVTRNIYSCFPCCLETVNPLLLKILDMACRYHWMSEHLPAEFRMKPSHGLIPPKDFNVISFRYDAGEPKVSLGRVVVYLNDSATTTMQVNLTATSHIAKVCSSALNEYST